MIDHNGRAKRAAIAALLVVGGVTGCAASPAPPRPGLDERVNAAFARDAAAIVEKDGVATAPTTHVLAGSAALDDGSRLTLWVSDPAAWTGVRSRCFYLDQETASSTDGWGGCGMPTDQVSVSRGGAVVVGTVGTWPAAFVRVTASGATVDLPVIGGYFLVPAPVAGPAGTPLTITLLGDGQHALGAIRDLVPPGSAVPHP